ncbi:phenylalanine 4-monooxygenase [soil metagenome]
MSKKTNYIAKKPDANGIVHYTAEENHVWHDLIVRQLEIIKNRACAEYLEGVRLLNFSQDRIPQLHEVNAVLHKATGWMVHPVAALISFDRFFDLLANRKFPAATFIRTREDFDYIQEPDIFHEFFGHCPMLTEPVYADFMQKYGEIGLAANQKDRVMLARLYWFTVEFGLINTAQGLRIYGGGILSSKTETIYAVESSVPQRDPLGIGLEALRTSYRIDILQPIYYVINNYKELYDLVDKDLIALINHARELGEFAPIYPART